MCLSAFGGTGIRSALLEKEGEAPGGRLRHWERAALELRRVCRGAARIPLRGYLSRISTSKVPGRNSQEPGSAAKSAKQTTGKEAVAAAEPIGGSIRQSGGGWSPPSPLFFNSLQSIKSGSPLDPFCPAKLSMLDLERITPLVELLNSSLQEGHIPLA
ncbi:hypothetical protein NDU88_001926 [Pleurodeles waltl]|uniref:Uncharacterized protein n=1 Tax=Pleurodeles waltl TaxID=8319 RepID=A0AAV7T0Z0_PLEWA|nr:hypothetical protein NDU88_001926 [Pleurodeles waltl]